MRHILRYFLICLVSLWILGFWYVFYGGRRSNGSSRSRSNNDYESVNAGGSDVYHDGGAAGDEVGYSKKDLVKRLHKAERLLVQLSEENKNNEALIKQLKQDSMDRVSNQIVQPRVSSRQVNELDGKFPSESFETQRRQIFHNLKDLSYFLNSEINTLLMSKEVNEATNKRLNRIKSSAQHRTNALIAQMYNMSVEGALGDWRATKADKMRDRVLEDLRQLQNPSDCKQARKVVCDLNKACGFGCQMHHVMYCFISSFFLNRTMILESGGWRYNSAGYGAYFLPVSDTCTSYTSSEKVVGWNDAGSESAQVIKIPIIDVLANRPKFLPLTVPKRYASELKSFHGDPFAWWAGEILNYLMRFNSDFKRVIKTKRVDLGFNNPCVGVHVRRTDKLIAEASFHSIDEYMRYVEEYFDILDVRSGERVQRTVFLATDELTVLQEAQKKYPSYKFIYDEANARSAAMAERYSPQSAQGVILDIHFLSQCDYLVCTLSSQVCRMAYELMQARYPDASWRFKSLDDVYYFGGQHGHRMRAVLAHSDAERQRGEISLAPGDIVGLAGDHWNGFSKVKNFRTNEEGLVPSYKLVEIVEEF